MKNINNLYIGFYNLFTNKILLLIQVIISFLLPIIPMIFLLLISIFIDTILGLYKAKKCGELITSHKLSRVISKILLYETTLILFFMIDKFILGDFVHLFISVDYFITKLIATFIIFIEITSMNENIKIAYNINLFQLFKNFILRTKKVKEEWNDFTGQ